MLARDGNLFVFRVHQLQGNGMNNGPAAGIWIIVEMWRVESLIASTVLLNSDPQKKKLLHPKSIPTNQCYNCTLIFNNFEMFRMKTFEIKPQTGGVNAQK